MQSDKINLIGFNREELIEELINKNIITEKEKYRVKQLWHWIYFQGISNFSEMSTVSSEFQNKLSKYYDESKNSKSISKSNFKNTTTSFFQLVRDYWLSKDSESIINPTNFRKSMCKMAGLTSVTARGSTDPYKEIFCGPEQHDPSEVLGLLFTIFEEITIKDQYLKDLFYFSKYKIIEGLDNDCPDADQKTGNFKNEPKLESEKKFRFVKKFASTSKLINSAVKKYKSEVIKKQFPKTQHSFKN